MGASEALGACLRDRCLGERFQIHCRGLDGRWITLNYVASTTSVRTLKFMLHCKTRLPPEDFVLVYRSKLLQPDKTLAASGITQDAGLQVLGRLRGGASSKGDGVLAEAAERPSRCYAVCTPSENEGFAVLTVYTVRSTGTTVRRAELEIATDPRLGLLRSSGEEAYGVEVDMMPLYPPTGQTGTANVTKAKQGAGRPRKGRVYQKRPLCSKCGRSRAVFGGVPGLCLKCGGG